MDPLDARKFIDEYLSKQGMYDMYLDLCMKIEAVPITREKFVDTYTDIFVRREELYEQAVKELPNDKKLLFERLEEAKMPMEDIVTVDSIPPFLTVTLNKIKEGIVCLYVMFPNGPESPHIVPSYVEKGSSDALFL
jgi:hypothetical protein